MLGTKTRRVLAALANPRPAKDTASDHLRSALQLLGSVLEFGALEDEDRKDARAAIRRMWLALSEIERDGGGRS